MELQKQDRERVKNAVDKAWNAAVQRGVEKGYEGCGLELHLVFDEDDGSHMVIGVAANLRCVGGDKDKSISTTAALETLRTVDWTSEFTRRARAAIGDLEDRLTVRRSPPEKWVHFLENGGVAARSQAISECVKSEYAPCLPALLTLLQADAPVGLEAIGAVGILGNENHLSRLAKLTASKDPETLLATLYAIQEIGGVKAQRYMRGIAEGHADPRMSTVAEQLLREMKEPN